MARTRHATVLQVEDRGLGIHHINIEADEPFDAVAGNTIILRSRVPHPDKPGEVIKRAVSLSTLPDRDHPRRFAVTIAAVGPFSRDLAARRPGDRIEFSGPWGKRFRIFDDDPDGPVHLFATGTGWSPIGAIATALVDRGRGPLAAWWQTGHAWDPDRLRALRQSPGVRVEVGEDLAPRVPADPEALYFLAGDGAVIGPLRNRLLAAGVAADRIRVEAFFHKHQVTG